MKLKNGIILGLALAVFSGCTDNFPEINTDKNQVTANNYSPVYSLTRAQLEYAGNHDFSYETWRVNIIYCSMITQQLANASWYAGDKYQSNQGWAASYFDVGFVDQVKYIVDLFETTKNDPQYANLHQISRIMKAIIFHRMTDIYGDIPYKEAGMGYYTGNLAPAYDKQQDIYADLLKELDEAAQALDPAGDKPGTGDLIYGSSVNQIGQWKKLAYSMMLRLGMRMIKVDPAAAKTWTEKAVAGGVFESNADNAFILHDASGGRNTVNRNSNILSGEWNAVTHAGEILLSKTFVDFLANNNDPRLQYMAMVQGNGDLTIANQIGLPNGLDQNGGATDVSTDPNYPGSIGDYSTIRTDILLKLDGPTFFLSYAQTEFLLAEAAKRGFSVGGSVQSHYDAGVTAAMKQLAQFNSSATIDDTDISDYLTANPYVDANGIEMINTQYWAASFLDWYEAWSNWRRTEFPTLVPVNYTGNATGGEIPRRMLYPTSEASVNATNYGAAIANQGANTFLTRVWWDAE